jgi:lysophospholipase L1-like esterase
VVIIKKILLAFLSLVLILSTSVIPVYAAPPTSNNTGNSIIVNKVVEDHREDKTVFKVELFKDGKHFDYGEISQDSPAIFSNLPTGNYTLEETVPEGFKLVSITPSNVSVKGKNNTYSMTVTNKVTPTPPADSTDPGDPTEPTDPTNPTDPIGPTNPEPPPTPPSIHYVALGDSLATGTTSRGTTTSYVYGFYNNLKTTYSDATVTMKNLSNDGDKASDLLSKLTNDSTFIAEVTKANIITVSIGGNNILGAGKNSFSQIDHQIAEDGTKAFESEYNLIIKKIRELNNDAKIIAMTLYNPYNTVAISGYTGDPKLHEEIKPYIRRINAQIQGITDSNYKVADVYSHFLTNYADKGKMGSVTYFYPSSLLKFTRDPHPNQTGQNEMAKIHNQVFSQF